jgi:hypothetical protein
MAGRDGSVTSGAPSAPDSTGLSRVVMQVVSGLSDYGRCAFGSGKAASPTVLPGDYSLQAAMREAGRE